MSREQLLEYTLALHHSHSYLKSVNAVLKEAVAGSESAQEHLNLRDQLLIIRRRYYGKSSERRPRPKPEEVLRGPRSKRDQKKKLLPSQRYPDLKLEEQEIDVAKDSGVPKCRLCTSSMAKMNQTEDAEYIAVTERTFHIVAQMRQKYRCTCCHGDIYTVPCPPRIVPGGAFSDEIAIDVAVAKYADHLPVERYVKQAARAGVHGLNHQTLIQQTHFLADFLEGAYLLLKRSIENSFYLHADETGWKMLEGDDTSNWQFWGFFDEGNAYYEAHDTRAGAVAEEFLKTCRAEFLVSDAFSGYGRSVKRAGKKNAYCNAHARRKWTDAEPDYPEATHALELYDKIYEIEREIRESAPEIRLLARQERSLPLMTELKRYAESLSCLPKSSVGRARRYMFKHWIGLTQFLTEGRLPIDNNAAERGMRGPVLGRKNFYGSHSKRGARTTAILYSLIESCKLCGVEPSRYLKDTVRAIHYNEPVLTPGQYALARKPVG